MKRNLFALIAVAAGLCACAATQQFLGDTANGAAGAAKTATQDSVNQKTTTATQNALGTSPK